MENDGQNKGKNIFYQNYASIFGTHICSYPNTLEITLIYQNKIILKHNNFQIRNFKSGAYFDAFINLTDNQFPTKNFYFDKDYLNISELSKEYINSLKLQI